ncbi:polyphosphate kinase 2 [Oceanomicrobium pacificus]|uniref:ADP/GDP-polyphosphate phosphotransferase n=1 Tax=Oceanomicrobium pacificus TaxID=2692916 RepID=A0A6B0TQG2_9RHOB|nr:polyphosphate kinase 2 [Oceanomicrobium pacificus]MXU66186.1 polyphosphate kinase 2 [Oceanomicrobium pacificus]
MSQDLPFDGAISRYYEKEAPKAVREAIDASGGDPILGPDYPYAEELPKSDYNDQYDALQVELAKMQNWLRDSGQRVVVLFEGRDAAGKGGAIKRVRENMNPRWTRVVALPKPTERQQTQWYFQRYVEHLPAAGELSLFDRSWYNRAVVERVFGFSTDAQRALFFDQVPDFERALVDDGIIFLKIWLTVGRAEQLRRFLARESDPLKQWKLSSIDVKGLSLWDDYTVAIREMLERTHRPGMPWTVIRADDKKRARLEVMRTLLSHVPYEKADPDASIGPDPTLTGGPALMDADLNA